MVTKLNPTGLVQVKVSKHVDAAGKIYLPYLHEWAHPASDLIGLVQICIVTFSEQPPVYAKPKQPAGLPYPMQPPGGGYPGGQQGYPGYPPQPQGGGGGYPQHIRLVVVIHLFTPLNLVMEQHRELEDLAILLTPHKEVEEVTLHILHQGEAILSNPSQLADRTAQG